MIWLSQQKISGGHSNNQPWHITDHNDIDASNKTAKDQKLHLLSNMAVATHR